MANPKNGSLWLTRSYNYVDRDPEIGRFQNAFEKERIKQSELAVLAGLADATVRNMFSGKTRRPAHSTFGKMAGAMGYEYKLARDGKPNYVAEVPKAKEQRKAYRALLAKKRKKNGH